MVYDNWNATVVGYSPDGKSRHAVCSVAAYRRWVNPFFFVGPHLPDPHGLLRGSGSTVRSVRIEQSADLDQRVKDLLDAAVVGWPWQFALATPNDHGHRCCVRQEVAAPMMRANGGDSAPRSRRRTSLVSVPIGLDQHAN